MFSIFKMEMYMNLLKAEPLPIQAYYVNKSKMLP